MAKLMEDKIVCQTIHPTENFISMNLLHIWISNTVVCAQGSQISLMMHLDLFHLPLGFGNLLLFCVKFNAALKFFTQSWFSY